MLASLTSRQVADWLAVYRLDPWGESRADLRTAIIACLLANIHRGKGKRPYKVEDFMAHRPRKRKQTAKEMHSTMMAFATMHNAAQKDK